jgi:poly(glycerol-phosphate) alpha-glucosyltransferase
MVEPWALKNSRWKKWVVWRLFERAHLSEAACLHALCEAERGDIRALGLTNPIAVIPNGVDLPPDLQSQPADPAPAEWRGRKVMLFLSRVHPKKGLVQLVRAAAPLSSASTPGPALPCRWRRYISGSWAEALPLKPWSAADRVVYRSVAIGNRQSSDEP